MENATYETMRNGMRNETKREKIYCECGWSNFVMYRLVDARYQFPCPNCGKQLTGPEGGHE